MSTEAETRRMVARLRELRAEHGRADVPFEIQVSSLDAFDVDGYRRLEEAGVTDVITAPWMLYGGGPFAPIAEKEAGLERFADDVFPRMKG
jgi:hypothetical protein